jgi:hypothetical protein
MTKPAGTHAAAIRRHVERTLEAAEATFTAALEQCHETYAIGLRDMWNAERRSSLGDRETALVLLGGALPSSRLASAATTLRCAMEAHQHGMWDETAGYAASADVTARVAQSELALQHQMRQLGMRASRVVADWLPAAGVGLAQVWRDLPVSIAVIMTDTLWRAVADDADPAREMTRVGVGRAVEALRLAVASLADDTDGDPQGRQLDLIDGAERKVAEAASRLGPPRSGPAGSEETVLGWIETGEAEYFHDGAGERGRSASPVGAYEAVRAAGERLAQLCDRRIDSDEFRPAGALWMPGYDIQDAFTYLSDGPVEDALDADPGFEDTLRSSLEHLESALQALLSRLDWDGATTDAQRVTAVLQTQPTWGDGDSSPDASTLVVLDDDPAPQRRTVIGNPCVD